MNAPISIVVIDDHPWIRLGLISLLKDDGHYEVLGEAESGQEALSLIQSTRPALAVIDISLRGDMDGLELTRQLKERFPAMAILVLSMHAEPKYAARALTAGAGAYLSKGEAPERLLSTLRNLTPSPSLA